MAGVNEISRKRCNIAYAVVHLLVVTAHLSKCMHPTVSLSNTVFGECLMQVVST